MSLERYPNNYSPKTLPFNTNRYFGGKSEDIYQPYTTNNFYAVFNLPERLFGRNKVDIERNLIATCITASIPDRTINYGEIPGFGGVKIYVATNQSISNTIELTFQETTDIPNWAAVERWCSIVNPHFGVANYQGQVQNDYKGELTLIICKSTCSGQYYTIGDIDSVYHFEGVAPTSSPGGTLDINDGEAKTQSLPLSFDGFPMMISNDKGLEKLTAYGITPATMNDRLDKY